MRDQRFRILLVPDTTPTWSAGSSVWESAHQRRYWKVEKKRTFRKGGQQIVGLDIGIGHICGCSHGDEMLESALELGVPFDGLAHGIVAEFVREHDCTALGVVSKM